MKSTKEKGKRKAQEMVRTVQDSRIAKENRRPPNKDSSKSRGRKKKTKISDGMVRRAVKYHKLKREVLAPFIAELLVIRFFDELKANLDSEATISHTFLENVTSDDENSRQGSASPAPSFHDDWRRDMSPISESE